MDKLIHKSVTNRDGDIVPIERQHRHLTVMVHQFIRDFSRKLNGKIMMIDNFDSPNIVVIVLAIGIIANRR